MGSNGKSRSVFERQQKIDGMMATLPSLKSFAISLTHDISRAEDLVQSTVARALANLDRFEFGTNMLAWLFTILRHLYHSEYRKRKRESEWDEKHENDLKFSTRMDDAEVSHDLKKTLLFIACLPNDQADALIAIGYLGLSYDDAAERLGCAVGTIKSRVNRARDSVAEMIESRATVRADLEKLKVATSRVPKNHPLYPIAQAYEELYALTAETDGSDAKEKSSASEVDRAWQKIVASGALDEYYDE